VDTTVQSELAEPRQAEPGPRPASGPGGRRPGRLVLALAGLALLLAGCSLVSGIVHTEQGLSNAGFGGAKVGFSTTNGQTVVTASVNDRGGSVRSQAQDVAQVVWQNFPGRFDLLQVTVNGRGTVTYSHAQLAANLGPRPDGLDDKTVGQQLASAAIIVVVVVVLVLAVALVVILLLVRASRRRRAQRTNQMNLMMNTLPPQVWGAPTGPGPWPGGQPPPGWFGPPGAPVPPGPPGPAGPPGPPPPDGPPLTPPPPGAPGPTWPPGPQPQGPSAGAPGPVPPWPSGPPVAPPPPGPGGWGAPPASGPADTPEP
jgi:hypothetical protein